MFETDPQTGEETDTVTTNHTLNQCTYVIQQIYDVNHVIYDPFICRKVTKTMMSSTAGNKTN